MNIQNNRQEILESAGRLGFGLMRLPMDGDQVDIERVKQMADAFLKAGFTYFDTSPVYVGGLSERAAREAIVERYPRQSFTLATKMPVWLLEKEEDLQKYFDLSLTSLGVDYIDYYLMHGMSETSSDRFPTSNASKADKFGTWAFLKEKKAQGKIKHIGFSFHDSAEVLDRMLEKYDGAEFVQLQINYADMDDEVIQSRRCYESARKHGVPIMIMEPLKGGTLVKLKEEHIKRLKKANAHAAPASSALRFAASLEGVASVLSGMSDMAQMEENIAAMSDFRPLDEGEKSALEEIVKRMKTSSHIGCTACKYCVDECPAHLPIPKFIEILNEYAAFDDLSLSKRRYQNAANKTAKASECLSCGLCESRCPQKLPIMSHMKNASSLFEEV